MAAHADIRRRNRAPQAAATATRTQSAAKDPPGAEHPSAAMGYAGGAHDETGGGGIGSSTSFVP